MLGSLTAEVAEIKAIPKDFPQAVSEALAYADAHNFLLDNLFARRDQFRAAEPDFDIDEIAIGPDGLERLEAMVEANRRLLPFGTFAAYSVSWLLVGDPDTSLQRAEATARFLASLLSWWADYANDHESAFPRNWRDEGNSALPTLSTLASRPAVFQALEKSFFRAEDWLSIIRALPPLILSDSRLNAPARYLLHQVYSCFVFGQCCF